MVSCVLMCWDRRGRSMQFIHNSDLCVCVCVCVCVRVEPPKVEEPVQWEEKQLSTLELSIHTHNKNPVETVHQLTHATSASTRYTS